MDVFSKRRQYLEGRQAGRGRCRPLINERLDQDFGQLHSCVTVLGSATLK